MWPFSSFEHRENKRRAEKLRQEAECRFRRNAADAITLEQAQKLHNALSSGLSTDAAFGHALGYGSAFVGATTAPAPKTATDLPMTRVADLAGYLGRVHEQLSMAAIAVAPYEEDPEKTKKSELVRHFTAAAAKAAQVQLDLLKIIQEAREDEAARAIRAQAEAEHADIAQTLRDAMQNRPQWAPEDLERYRKAATATEPLEPNRVGTQPCDACDGEGELNGHQCLNCDNDPART